jgi:tetratricopeptide (TPR) repeat protein
MRCSSARELISDYVDGALSPDRAAELKAHLEGCRDCRELAHDFAAIVERAKGSNELEPSAEVWPRIAAAVGRALGEEPAAARERRNRRTAFWKPAPWALAAAAALVLVFAGVLMIRQRSGSAARAASERSIEFTLAKLQEAQEYYEKAIQALNEAVRSQEGDMDPRLTEAFNRNLAAIDETIQACRQIVQQDPDNLTVRAYLLTAYREKVSFLEELMSIERSAASGRAETTL